MIMEIMVKKYFDMYLEIEPQSVNGLCDKAMSLSNKNKLKRSYRIYG